MILMTLTAVEKFMRDVEIKRHAPGKVIKTWEIMFMAETLWLEANLTVAFMCNFFYASTEYKAILSESKDKTSGTSLLSKWCQK